MRRVCSSYQGVDFSHELPQMLRDTRRLRHAEYIATARNHKFCVVAPGDFTSTHKVTEAMAIGGASGCIPVFVLPSKLANKIDSLTDVVGVLPFTRWLDYCDVSYLVSTTMAATNMRGILDQLARVSASEAAEKLAALRRVRDAFVFRRGSTPSNPSAAEFIISEFCAAGEQWRRTAGTSAAFAPAAADVSRCTLTAK